MNRNIHKRRGQNLVATTIALTLFASLGSTTAQATGSSSSQPVTVYKHVRFRGNSLSLGEGDVSFRTIRRSSVGNDAISSIRIEPGYEVLACQHSRFRGRCETFSNTTRDLRKISFNDVISSLRVTKVTSEPATNLAPIAADGNFSTNADSVLTFFLPATDPDNDNLQFSVPAFLSANSDGSYSYDPTTTYGELLVGDSATLRFDYSASDAEETDTGTITITINGTVQAPVQPTYVVGQTGPGGGTVFSVSSDGTSGLEYAPDIFSQRSWGCSGTNVDLNNSATNNGVDVATGAVSSGLIQAAIDASDCQTSPAAAVTAFNYETGTEINWYLPSTDELVAIRDSEVSGVELPGGGGTPYWSSTEDTSSNAFLVLVRAINNPDDTGQPSTSAKTNVANVLPISSF